MEIANPARSDSKCAASVKIAKDPEIIPPIISVTINMVQTIDTQIRSLISFAFFSAVVSLCVLMVMLSWLLRLDNNGFVFDIIG